MDHPVLAEKELGGIVRARQELGDRLLRDAGDRRDLVEVLHQQRLRQHRKVARLAAIDVDVPLRDDPAVVRRALAHVAHEAAEFVELQRLELRAAEFPGAPNLTRLPDRDHQLQEHRSVPESFAST